MCKVDVYNKKKSLIGYLIIGLLIESFSLVGFIFISRICYATPGKDICIAIFILGAILVFAFAVRRLKVSKIFHLVIFLTLGFVVFIWTIGLLWFPGLIKDQPPDLIFMQLVGLFIFHSLIAFVCWLVSKKYHINYFFTYIKRKI